MHSSKSDRRLIIDTDTASDDAVAIIMALRYPGVSVEALTIVAGNVGVQQASVNARYTLQLCNAAVPVYNGSAKPLNREAAPADWFHGPDGMGDMNYPPPIQSAEDANAVEELVKRFAAEPGEIDLITLGPLTNIAKALQLQPAMAGWIRHCYIMGGAACTVGNVTPAAEYNIWCDPEAAHIVFHSGLPITMIGWELSCGAANLTDHEMAEIRALNTELAHFAIDCNTHALKAVREIQGEAGLALADPVAMAIALDRACCCESSEHFVDVSCDAALTRGMTVVDKLNVTGQPANVEICWKLDASRWKALLRQSLS